MKTRYKMQSNEEQLEKIRKAAIDIHKASTAMNKIFRKLPEDIKTIITALDEIKFSQKTNEKEEYV